MADNKSKQTQRERKPPHKIFLEMTRESAEVIKNEPSIGMVQSALDRLDATLQAIDQSIVPEKELSAFTTELQEIANYYRNHGIGRRIDAVIMRLLT